MWRLKTGGQWWMFRNGARSLLHAWCDAIVPSASGDPERHSTFVASSSRASLSRQLPSCLMTGRGPSRAVRRFETCVALANSKTSRSPVCFHSLQNDERRQDSRLRHAETRSRGYQLGAPLHRHMGTSHRRGPRELPGLDLTFS